MIEINKMFKILTSEVYCLVVDNDTHICNSVKSFVFVNKNIAYL